MSENLMHTEAAEAASPVHTEEVDPRDRSFTKGIALCLSGGGYRAMLFHLGALWRLNELGYLSRLDRISSVSGGSITAGVLAINWNSLEFGADGVAANFGPMVVDPLRKLGGRTIDEWSILKQIFLWGSAADRIVKYYSRFLFGKKTLQDLPDKPRFVINATNVQTGVLWRFSKPYTWDYRVGEIARPTFEVAQAVAASSAFPPFLSPLVLSLKGRTFTPGTGSGLQRPPFTEKAVLTDGGVYDNLGLETAWKNYETVLVSDAGGILVPLEKVQTDWGRHLYRILFVIDNQVRSLRKRQVVQSYKMKQRLGTYWGIRTDIANYKLEDPLPCPFEKTTRIAEIATRLKKLPSDAQEKLINWGYAVCDAAMRKHVGGGNPTPPQFPYPAVGVG
ncbi:MAG TPA: patatin-like phospholipase family protein [Pyrinomonadaceae bacterium]|nr:patatin-like phospholipase family protein [Pyrinomonadaceae bacterium]